MKNAILRILIGVILVSLISVFVVMIIGWLHSWNSPTQFSDGFFTAGVILVAIGFVSLLGYRQRAIDWPPSQMEPADRDKLSAADTSRGKILMVAFGISSLLLFGLSILVSTLF